MIGVTADVIAGRFALCDPIGSGGSGTVWRAFDEKRPGYCAAKLLRQRDAGDLLRFVREQSVRLDHPHIVSPYSWVAEDGTVLIASDLMSGGSLHTLIGDFGPLADSTVATVLLQVLSGLRAVHDAELIHRDVKPANLLLRATGDGPLHVVLTDFGLTISRMDARLTQVGMVIGTPGYVPPEVLKGGVPPDPRHDLYAVGRLALTMIAGGEPKGGTAEWISTIADADLRATVQALLRHDPEQRPADAAAAAAMLHGNGQRRTDGLPRTRDGDRIEVLDQLPALPAGWGPDGPIDSLAPELDRPAPRATIVDVVPTAPAFVSGPAPTVTGPPGPAPLPQTPAASPPQAPNQLPAGRPPTRRRGPILIAAAVAAVLVAGFALVVWLLPDGTTGNPSNPPVTTATSPNPTPTTTPTVNATGTSTGGTTPGTPSVLPTATATVTPENLRAGDPCTWQQEGDRRTGVDGDALACTLADGSYQWRTPG